MTDDNKTTFPTIYVRRTGSDETGDGSIENPVRTIEKANQIAEQRRLEDAAKHSS